jgi:uroporphyrinogen decarboxylase
MKLQNDIVLRAARGEKTERSPVWLMRQAGRILPEYRAIRSKLSGFIELVETPELAAEVTLQPVDLLDVDAAIIFSDILVVPQAMGCAYEMIESKGPYFPKTVRNFTDLHSIRIADPGADLKFVTDAIRITKQQLNGRVPLIGFAGAPWTIFAYMTEGSGSKTFSVSRRLLYEEAKFSHTLLERITESTIAYLKAQIEAGADMVQLFDSWAGILGPAQYAEFATPYIARIAEAITEVPVTVFSKGAFFALGELSSLPCNTLGLDWHTDIRWAKTQLKRPVTLQGNADPCLLYGSEETIKTGVADMLEAFGDHPHIANLGHGLYPDTDAEKVRYFIKEVKNYKRQG